MTDTTMTEKLESIAIKLGDCADELKSLYPDSAYAQRIIDAINRASNVTVDLEHDHDLLENNPDPDYDPEID